LNPAAVYRGLQCAQCIHRIDHAGHGTALAQLVRVTAAAA